MDSPLKKFDEVIEAINMDNYYLTRNESDSFEYRLRDLQKQLKELYIKKGRILNERLSK